MKISKEDYKLLKLITSVFTPSYPIQESWVINGLWRDGQEKLISLLTKQSALTSLQLKEAGTGQLDFPFKTAYVSFLEGISDKHATYYQQRYHATEVEDIKTLRKFLFGNTDYKIVHKHYKLLEQFNLRHLLDEEVIKLSNGETRKASILKALLTEPQILILDNPFVGIDQKSAPEIDRFLNDLTSTGLSIILISNTDIPDWVSKVLWINSPEEILVFSRDEFIRTKPVTHAPQKPIKQFEIPPVNNPDKGCIVRLNKVNVNYGGKVVLENINWEITQGEKWLLTGRNGAGKSTLLSLIYADHPQSYSNDIELFGRKRGSGESIWDLKEKMAFYSPELCYYFNKECSCREAVLSGIYFHPFKKKIIYAGLESFAHSLFLHFFTADKLNKPLHSLTGVEQRLVLFLRALAQNCPLVLLDEPFQGFDHALTLKCKQLTELCCRDKTVIFVSHHPEDIPAFISKEFHLN